MLKKKVFWVWGRTDSASFTLFFLDSHWIIVGVVGLGVIVGVVGLGVAGCCGSLAVAGSDVSCWCLF